MEVWITGMTNSYSVVLIPIELHRVVATAMPQNDGGVI